MNRPTENQLAFMQRDLRVWRAERFAEELAALERLVEDLAGRCESHRTFGTPVPSTHELADLGLQVGRFPEPWRSQLVAKLEDAVRLATFAPEGLRG